MISLIQQSAGTFTGLLFGIVVGLIPYFVAKRHNLQRFGLAAVISAAGAGFLLGIGLAAPVATVFTIIILRRAGETVKAWRYLLALFLSLGAVGGLWAITRVVPDLFTRYAEAGTPFPSWLEALVSVNNFWARFGWLVGPVIVIGALVFTMMRDARKRSNSMADTA